MIKSVIFISLLISLDKAQTPEWFIKNNDGLDPGRIT